MKVMQFDYIMKFIENLLKFLENIENWKTDWRISFKYLMLGTH